MKMKNKGYVVIWDAMVALVVFLFIYVTFIASYEPRVNKDSINSFKMIHYVSEDSIDVLNKQGVLDEIGTDWAASNGTTNSSSWLAAVNISKAYLDKLIPDRFGYQLVIEDRGITFNISDTNLDNSSRRPKYDAASSRTYSSRLLVGYGAGEPTRGEVARAFLTNIREKTESSYAYFGGFEGQGTLTKYITLPDGIDTVQSICLEYDAGDVFTLKIDGNAVPGTFPENVINMTANSQCVTNPGNYIHAGSPGQHVFMLNFTGGDDENYYISGGFIVVTYNTSEFDTSPDTGKVRYEFPGINGLINLYSSFYVPGTLNSMNMHLKFLNNYSTKLRLGNVDVFDVPKNMSFCTKAGNVYTCDMSNANFSKIFGGPPYPAFLSGQTIPLRMEAYNITGETGMLGTADVVLITDLSGSMSYYIGSDHTGGHTIDDCSNPAINNSDTSRISLAKCLDKNFINAILDGSGNRVGLVGFDTDTSSQALTTNAASLTSTVNGYSANGGTCLCCAINKAMTLFNDSLTLLPQGSGWKYKQNSSCGDSCDPTTIPANCNISGWNNLSYNDSNWNTWNPVATGDNGSALSNVVYYRKHFNVTLSSISGNPTLDLRNQRGVECYLNGNLLGRDTSCGTASYWDWSWSVPKTFFNTTGTDNVLACRVRSGSSSNPTDRRGTKFDATITASQKRYIIVMTDGVAGFSCGQCGNSASCSNPIGLCSGSCAQTSADSSQSGPDYQCSGTPPGSCTDSDCQPAMNDAICAARTAFNSYSVTKMYSVGFGPVDTCTNGRQTLQSIAQCGDNGSTGSYYGSNDASQLGMIYNQIAEDIVNTTQTAQVINVTGDVVPSILYPESYIDFYYTSTDSSGYGNISLTQSTDRFNKTNDCTGTLYVPSIAKASDVMVTSYSDEHWTDYVKVGILAPAYTLRDLHFGSDYSIIGDPYIVHIPPTMINSGQNNSILIGTGDNPTTPTNCSKYNRAIYTLRLSGRVGYAGVFAEKDGCNWTIQFEDGSSMNEAIPVEYNGTKQCSYTGTNVTYDLNDAVDDAAFRLLRQLDIQPNNKLDIKFDSNMLEFDFSRSGGVQSLWGPINMKLIVWM